MSLVLDNVCIGYKDNVLIENVNISVSSGETVCVGTGVLDGGTSLLKTCAGVIYGLSGEVRINNMPINKMSLAERFDAVSFCYEFGGLISVFSNFNNIAFPIGYHLNIKRKEITRRIIDIAEKLNIVDLMNLEPFQLNDVQVRLMNLARALVIRPKVILLDELQAGMSSAVRERVLTVLAEEQRTHGYAIMMTITAGDDTTMAARRYRIDNKQIVSEKL